MVSIKSGTKFHPLTRIPNPRSTVYNIFRAFQRDGVWEAIWEELRAALRQRLGREASPAPTTVQDSSSCRAAGSLSGPSPGSAAIAASPRITRTSPTPSRPSSRSPASSSPSGGSRVQTFESGSKPTPLVKPTREPTVYHSRTHRELIPMIQAG